MATELPFPRTRHLALAAPPSLSEAGADGRALLAQAAILPLEALAQEERATPIPRPSAAPAGAPAAQAGAGVDGAESARLWRIASVDLSRPGNGDEACLDEDGNRAAGGEPVRCPSSLEGRLHAARLAVQAVAAGDAVILHGLARWYALGPSAAGYCSSCEEALIEALRGTYGEHVLRFPAISAGGARDLPPGERPFAGLRELLRFTEPLEAAKRSILRARDEARRSRGVELMVFAATESLDALGLALCRHLDGLLFTLPSADPLEALFPLLAARAALGERPAIAVAPEHASAAQVSQLAALAAACDVDLMLAAAPALAAGSQEAPGAAATEAVQAALPARAALAAQRRYQSLLRERFRATTPLADLTLLISPRADHWSGGKHLRASATACAALTSAQLQISLRIDQLPAGQAHRQVLVLCGCEALPQEQAAAVRRHVEGGGDLLLAGPCTLIDDEGRRGEPLFPGLKPGLERQGEGRVWAIAPQGALPPPTQLGPLLLRAARELLGRGRQSLTLSGRGRIFARAYLDPERKLDVHLVNLGLTEAGFGPAQGLTLHIAGQAAGGGRLGYWFAPEHAAGRDGERIALNPSGFSVSTVLPAIGATALLAVPR